MFIAAVLSLVLITGGCATSSGSLFKDMVSDSSEEKGSEEASEGGGSKEDIKEEKAEVEKKEKPKYEKADEIEEEEEEAEEEEERTGIYIESSPGDAEVYINGFYEGDTPLYLENYEEGQYALEIRKSGYYKETVWIQYDGETYTEYRITLEEITGFLEVNFQPADAEVLVGGERVSMGTMELQIGTYTLTVREFGYEEFSQSVTIRENETTTVSGVLEPAEFRVSSVRVSKQLFNPKNPGSLGQIEFSFRVSTYGSGSASIYNEKNKKVAEYNFPRFATWRQSAVWNGRTGSGQVLPDGEYRAVLTAQSEEGGVVETEEITVRIDSSYIISYRSTWSGVSGMLYAASPEVLPPLSSQLSASFMGHYETDAAGEYYRLPIQVSYRFSPVKRLELALQGSLIPQTGDTAFSLGLSAKYRIVDVPFFGLAGALKGTYYSGDTLDSQTNYLGGSASFPLMLALGPVRFVFTPEIALSPARVVYDSTATYPDSPVYVWPYARAGIHLQFGGLTFGLSGALRFVPFTEGFTVHWPAAVGLEASWILPDTQFGVILQAAGEISPSSGFYLMGGIGFALLN